MVAPAVGSPRLPDGADIWGSEGRAEKEKEWEMKKKRKRNKRDGKRREWQQEWNVEERERGKERREGENKGRNRGKEREELATRKNSCAATRKISERSESVNCIGSSYQ